MTLIEMAILHVRDIEVANRTTSSCDRAHGPARSPHGPDLFKRRWLQGEAGALVSRRGRADPSGRRGSGAGVHRDRRSGCRQGNLGEFCVADGK